MTKTNINKKIVEKLLGIKIIRDNRVKELRMPQKIIDLLAEETKTAIDSFEKQEDKAKKENIVPTRVIVCTTCGFKEPLKKDQNASTSICKKCGRKGLSVR